MNQNLTSRWFYAWTVRVHKLEVPKLGWQPWLEVVKQVSCLVVQICYCGWSVRTPSRRLIREWILLPSHIVACRLSLVVAHPTTQPLNDQRQPCI